MSRFVVIGGANVDIMGIADQALRSQDSNPGTIRTTLGGVGRNIAENLARLDEAVSLGQRGWGRQLRPLDFETRPRMRRGYALGPIASGTADIGISGHP